MEFKNKKRRAKKVWQKIFTPQCFGEEEKLRKCIWIFILGERIACKYYDDCLKAPSRRLDLKIKEGIKGKADA